MKRKRNSTQKPNEEAHQVFDENPQRTSASITDLPMPILNDILLRLSVKRIINCKSVCKTWYSLITDPEFAKLHFAQAEVCPLLRPLDLVRVSRILYMVEPGLDLGYCACDSPGTKGDHQVNTKLDSRIKLPLRNPEMLMNNEDGVTKMGKRFVSLKPKDHKFKIVNSCNGFLCLSEVRNNYPVVVCNPISGDYINIPLSKTANEKYRLPIDCGFGFAPKTKKYKVIIMFDLVLGFGTKGAELHTLGSGLWKTIDSAPYSYYKLAFPTYLNGYLYWLRPHCGNKGQSIIVSFDFDNEQFQSVPPPPFEYIRVYAECPRSMGVLKGCVCIIDTYLNDPIDVWVMKQSGDQQSWTKEFSIDTTLERWPYGLYQPMSYLKNGALLMFHYPNSALICWDPEKQEIQKYFMTRGVKSKFEAFVYMPSFISLKDAVVGDNVVVLNFFKERGWEFKLQGETKAVFLEEEDRKIASVSNREMVSDSDCSTIDNYKWWSHFWQK